MKYVIKIGHKKDNHTKWYYYDGNTYMIRNECLAEDFFTTLDKAKRYPNQKAAEKEADKLYNKCSNVDIWFVEEVEE